MYTLNFANESPMNATFIVFQKYPNAPQLGLEPLAWHTSDVPSTGNSSFNWEEDYFFVWGQTGRLQPGLAFNPRQTVAADPNSANALTFEAVGGSYSLENIHQEMPSQVLKILENPTIPMNQLAVGIGMAGKATGIAQALPNMMLQISAEPQYWVGVGQFKEGQIINEQMIQPLTSINFSGGATTLNVTLSESMTLSVS